MAQRGPVLPTMRFGVDSNDPIGFELHELLFTRAELAVFRTLFTFDAAVASSAAILSRFVSPPSVVDAVHWEAFRRIQPCDLTRYYANDAHRVLKHYRLACGMSRAMWMATQRENPLPRSVFNYVTVGMEPKFSAVSRLRDLEATGARPNAVAVLYAYFVRISAGRPQAPAVTPDRKWQADWVARGVGFCTPPPPPVRWRGAGERPSIFWTPFERCVEFYLQSTRYRAWLAIHFIITRSLLKTDPSSYMIKLRGNPEPIVSTHVRDHFVEYAGPDVLPDTTLVNRKHIDARLGFCVLSNAGGDPCIIKSFVLCTPRRQ